MDRPDLYWEKATISEALASQIAREQTCRVCVFTCVSVSVSYKVPKI